MTILFAGQPTVSIHPEKLCFSHHQISVKMATDATDVTGTTDATGATESKPPKQSFLSQYLLCLSVHKLFFLITIFILMWVAVEIFALGEEIGDNLEPVAFLIGDMSECSELLSIAAIALAVGAAVFGLLAVLTGMRLLLRLHMITLTLITWFVAYYLFALYKGMDSQTVAEIHGRYVTALEIALADQDADGVKYVTAVHGYLKCCGFNSSNDFPIKVFPSCCDLPENGTCLLEDIYELGCAKAFESKLEPTMVRMVDVLSIALLIMSFVLAYLFVYIWVMNRRDLRADIQATKALEKKKKEAEETV